MPLLHGATDFLAEHGIRRRYLDDRVSAVTHGRNRFRDIVWIGYHEDRQIPLEFACFLQEFIDAFLAQIVGDDEAARIL